MAREASREPTRGEIEQATQLVGQGEQLMADAIREEARLLAADEGDREQMRVIRERTRRRLGAMLGLVLAPRRWLVIIALSPLLIGAFAAEAPATAGSLHNLSQAQADVDGVAYAGRVRVYTSGGRLVRLAPGQRAMAVARLRGRAYDVAASPTMVALVESRGRSRRLLAGPPGGPLRTLARCTGPSEEIPAPLLAVSGDTVAEALTCRRGGFQGATGVRLHTTGTVRTIFPPVGARVIGLSGAPGHLAIATQASGLRGPVRVQVNDSRAGAERYSVAGLPQPFLAYAPVGVQADGLAVFCGAHGRLAWASAAASSAHPVGRVGCPDSTLKVASGRVAYRSTPSDAYRVSDLAGRVRTLVRPSGDLPLTSTASGCWYGDWAVARTSWARPPDRRGPTVGDRAGCGCWRSSGATGLGRCR